MGLGGLGPCRALARRPEPAEAGQTSGTDWGPSFLKVVRASDMAAAQGPAQGNRASLPLLCPRGAGFSGGFFDGRGWGRDLLKGRGGDGGGHATAGRYRAERKKVLLLAWRLDWLLFISK